jgi:hypothetical protein
MKESGTSVSLAKSFFENINVNLKENSDDTIIVMKIIKTIQSSMTRIVDLLKTVEYSRISFIKPENNMSSTITKRDLLADYENKRVKAEGYYDKCNVITDFRTYKLNKTVLLQDVVVFVNDKELLIGHLWVQQANAIVNLKSKTGQKISFAARVGQYAKYNKESMMKEFHYCLTNPDNAEIVGEMNIRTYSGGYTAIRPAAAITPAAKVLTLSAKLQEVKAFAAKVDKETMKAFMPHFGEIIALAEKCGGPEELSDLLGFLL